MRNTIPISILLTVFLFFPSAEKAVSQNWRNICSSGKTFYFRAAYPLEGFRTDSVSSPSGGDTLWYSFIRFRGPAGQCLDSTHGSILGRKVYGRGNGMFYFFNSADDSLRLKTNASLNASWTFFSHSGQPTITAQVTAIILDTVMEVMDSVKVITLSGFGPGITATIKLSKHHGISFCTDLYEFPQLNSVWKLVGKTQDGIGFQAITSWRQIFGYDPGDEFHIYHRKDIAYPMYKDTLKNVRILETVWATDSSWVKYTYSVCMHIKHNMPPPSYKDTVISDTIVQTCNSFGSSWEASRLSRMSFEKDGMRGHKLWYMMYNNRQGVYYGSIDYMWTNGCWRKYGGQMPVPTGETYAPGLGMTDYWVSAHSQGEWRQLRYYKKGSETWGSPNIVHCVNTGIGKLPPEAHPEILPNPADDYFFIRLNNSYRPGDYLCTVTDLQGRLVYSRRFTGTSLFVESADFRKGMYILTLKDMKTGRESNCKLMIN